MNSLPVTSGTGFIPNGEGAGDAGAGVREKAYLTYRLMTQKLHGVDWRHIEIISEGEHNISCYSLKKPERGEAVYALCWDWFKGGDNKAERKTAKIAD